MFSVRAAGNVHILLGGEAGDPSKNAYEITLGYKSNNASYIKEDIRGSVIHEVETPGILSENEMRTFWVSWQNGTVEFGRGADDQTKPITSWQDPEPKDIVQAYFDTGNGHVGRWEFIRLDGELFRSLFSSNYDYLITVPSQFNSLWLDYFSSQCLHNIHTSGTALQHCMV